MQELIRELRWRTARIAQGGGAKAVERHCSRGKLAARERIDRLVDPRAAVAHRAPSSRVVAVP